MKRERDLALQEKYPKILRDLGGNMSETCMSWAHGGIAVGDGWISLLESVFKFAQFNTDKNKYPQLVADQIKEKFGSLRFYYHFEPTEASLEYAASDAGKKWPREEAYIAGAINFAELMSGQICERCGKPAKCKNRKGWLSTLCEDCEKPEAA